jgi:hypothetical protein
MVLPEVTVFRDAHGRHGSSFFKRLGDRGPSYTSYSSPYIVSVKAFDCVDVVVLTSAGAIHAL